MTESQYSYRTRDDILEVTCGVDATIPGIAEYLSIITDELEGTDYRLLVLDRISGIIPTVSDVTAFCDAISVEPKLIDKAAVCIDSVVQVGMAKVLLAVFSHPTVALKIFTDTDDAIAWLRSD